MNELKHNADVANTSTYQFIIRNWQLASEHDDQEQTIKLYLERSQALVKALFGYKSLRAAQVQVLTEIYKNRDCLAVLSTGSGKSFNYLLPALVRPGLVLVVSPLIALIRDQLRRFKAYDLPCAAFDSHQTWEEQRSIWRELEQGRVKLLLVSPERLARIPFRQRLASYPLQLVAVDEAHCISQWGHRFRPDYRLVHRYLQDLQPESKLALTATATKAVQTDIMTTLGFRDPALITGDLTRSNLELVVQETKKTSEQYDLMADAAYRHTGSGVIYTPTRKSAWHVHHRLKPKEPSTALYHAGLSRHHRQAAHSDFIRGNVRVVIATHAFGMGIDKSDIRFVHHLGLPSSLESYVQEIGRAGRDDLPAKCLLLYNPRDFHLQKFMIDQSFPDRKVLQRVFQATLDREDQRFGLDEQRLLANLSTDLGLDFNTCRVALDLLCREELLNRYESRDSSHTNVIISRGQYRCNEEEFWRSYPDRKNVQMLKLEAMRAYAELGDQRMDFLNRYFEK